MNKDLPITVNNPANTRSDRKTISVIIPTLGRESIKYCLDAIEQQTYPPDELLVVRDTEKLGIGLTRNAGIAQAKGELIAFTDDDCVPPENWPENMLAIMKQYDADVVGGTMSEADPFLSAIRKRRPFPSVLQEDHSGVVGNGANIIYKRSVLEECLKRDGYIYHSHKSLGEDIDLIWRIRQRGAKIVYTPSTVRHLRESTYTIYLKRQFIKGIGIAGLHSSYRKAKVQFTPQPSLLWGYGKSGRKANWLKAVWVKAIGPFDIGSFQSFSDFLVFWLGEKIQGIGFLWGLFARDGE